MNKKTYISLWVIIQSILLVLPILFGVVIADYKISYDQHYIETVNVRALEQSHEDITSAVISWKDAENKYEDKVWKLQNQEVYYFRFIFAGFLISVMFQLLNFTWQNTYYDDYC